MTAHVEHKASRAARIKAAQHVKRRCHRCRGSGHAACTICGGSGQVLRGADGQGNPQFGRCEGCFGTKSRRCPTCGGEGLF